MDPWQPAHAPWLVLAVHRCRLVIDALKAGGWMAPGGNAFGSGGAMGSHISLRRTKAPRRMGEVCSPLVRRIAARERMPPWWVPSSMVRPSAAVLGEIPYSCASAGDFTNDRVDVKRSLYVPCSSNVRES